jgi:hypothetical protein
MTQLQIGSLPVQPIPVAKPMQVSGLQQRWLGLQV